MSHYHYIEGQLQEIPELVRDPDETALVLLFSCGCTSLVGSLIALHENRKGENLPVHIIYTMVRQEPEDNLRFLADAQKLFKQPVRILMNDKYNGDIYEVQRQTRWIAGVNGARCTKELKWKERVKFVNATDIQMFGFHYGEADRLEKFQRNNPDVDIICPLIDNKITKADALAFIARIGLTAPKAYSEGWQNANCIGCVKGQSGYWNKVRIHHPDVFAKQAEIEREINAAINKRYITCRENTIEKINALLVADNKPPVTEADYGKRIRLRVFLDQLDPEAGKYDPIELPDCGVVCQTEAERRPA